MKLKLKLKTKQKLLTNKFFSTKRTYLTSAFLFSSSLEESDESDESDDDDDDDEDEADKVLLFVLSA